MINKKLSILTCSLTNRKEKLNHLDKILLPQIKYNSYVELLTNVDSGEKTIGKKRNELMESAKGDYIVYVDDDDLISEDYVKKILTAISYKSPDCCGIEGYIYLTPRNKKKFIHSIRYTEWTEDNLAYYRSPNHLNPIKREIALEVGFEDLSHGEDFIFSKKITPLLKTETYIKGEIYHYLPSSSYK